MALKQRRNMYVASAFSLPDSFSDLTFPLTCLPFDFPSLPFPFLPRIVAIKTRSETFSSLAARYSPIRISQSFRLSKNSLLLSLFLFPAFPRVQYSGQQSRKTIPRATLVLILQTSPCLQNIALGTKLCNSEGLTLTLRNQHREKPPSSINHRLFNHPSEKPVPNVAAVAIASSQPRRLVKAFKLERPLYPMLILAIEGTDFELSPWINKRRRHLTDDRSVTSAPLRWRWWINVKGVCKWQCSFSWWKQAY